MYRILKGLKQSYIAMKLGVSQQAYSKLEQQENLKPSTLRKIAEVFECASDDIQNLTHERLENFIHIK